MPASGKNTRITAATISARQIYTKAGLRAAGDVATGAAQRYAGDHAGEITPIQRTANACTLRKGEISKSTPAYNSNNSGRAAVFCQRQCHWRQGREQLTGAEHVDIAIAIKAYAAAAVKKGRNPRLKTAKEWNLEY